MDKNQQHNPNNCKCISCEQGSAAARKMEQQSIEKLGWYSHFTFGDPMCPYETNLHTHNVKEAFGHKDLQICFNIPVEIGHSILTDIINQIKGGAKFETGVEYDNVLGNGFKAKFIDAFEGGRPVLRLVLPDPNGKYEGKYAEQFTKLNNEEFNPLMN